MNSGHCAGNKQTADGVYIIVGLYLDMEKCIVGANRPQTVCILWWGSTYGVVYSGHCDGHQQTADGVYIMVGAALGTNRPQTVCITALV